MRTLFGADVEAHRLFIKRMFKRLMTGLVSLVIVISSGAFLLFKDEIQSAAETDLKTFVNREEMAKSTELAINDIAASQEFLERLNIEPIPGPRGHIRPREDQGDKSSNGDAGTMGNQGDKGDPRPRGPQRPKGDVGDMGPRSAGDTGDRGERGPPGFAIGRLRGHTEIETATSECRAKNYCSTDVGCFGDGILLGGRYSAISDEPRSIIVTQNLPNRERSFWHVTAYFRNLIALRPEQFA